MREVVLADPVDFTAWRSAARPLLAEGLPPDRVAWRVAGDAAAGLFAGNAAASAAASAAEDCAATTGDSDPPATGDTGTRDSPGAGGLAIPRRFVALGEAAICHADAGRFDVLYRLAWRLTHGGEPRLLDDASDPVLRRAERMAGEVRREVHKMHAFVRFRAVPDAPGDVPVFVAWFEPQHHTLARAAPFFRDRFAGQRWSIITPTASVHWDGERMAFAPGADASTAPRGDDLEGLWRRYYASIFNPARVNPKVMQAQMPKKYWRNLPEATLIPDLVAGAARRTGEMLAAAPAAPRPTRAPRAAIAAAAAQDGDAPAAPAPSLSQLAERARACRACPLWEPATQTVFGAGPATARIVLVGEQPGDQEDLAGQPFVGPAGRVLDEALGQAGIDRTAVYVTNAVKHFKYVVRGKRRVHQRPSVTEIEICAGEWLAGELALLDPALVVLLGASAARAVLGRDVVIGRMRGRILEEGERRLLVTVHPSYLLRLPDEATKANERQRFVADLRLATPFAA